MKERFATSLLIAAAFDGGIGGAAVNVAAKPTPPAPVTSYKHPVRTDRDRTIDLIQWFSYFARAVQARFTSIRPRSWPQVLRPDHPQDTAGDQVSSPGDWIREPLQPTCPGRQHGFDRCMTVVGYPVAHRRESRPSRWRRGAGIPNKTTTASHRDSRAHGAYSWSSRYSFSHRVPRRQDHHGGSGVITVVQGRGHAESRRNRQTTRWATAFRNARPDAAGLQPRHLSADVVATYLPTRRAQLTTNDLVHFESIQENSDETVSELILGHRRNHRDRRSERDGALPTLEPAITNDRPGHRATLYDSVQVNEDRTSSRPRCDRRQMQTITFQPQAPAAGTSTRARVVIVGPVTYSITIPNARPSSYGPHERSSRGGTDPRYGPQRQRHRPMLPSTRLSLAPSEARSASKPALLAVPSHKPHWAGFRRPSLLIRVGSI